MTSAEFLESSPDPWQLLQAGENARGLHLLRDCCERDASLGHVLELARGLLWTGDYRSAASLLEDARQNSPNANELHEISGLVAWCLEDSRGAMHEWSGGIQTQAREQRRTRLALLMMAAAVLTLDYQHKRKAVAELSSTLSGPGSTKWPNDLVRTVLGLNNDTKLSRKLAPTSEVEQRVRAWLDEFYRAIRNFDLRFPPQLEGGSSRLAEMKGAMNRLANTDRPEWEETPPFQLLISQPEFFMARHIAKRGFQVNVPQGASFSPSAWELLRKGEKRQGVDVLLEKYNEKPSTSHTMSLGVAYLWIEDYESAWTHFQHAIATQRWTSDSYYGMAGTAKWCSNEPEAAMECWKSGLDCDYGDAGGASVGNRLLLFVASVLRKDARAEKEAIALLKAKKDDPRISTWPGPLVLLALGKKNVDLGMERAKRPQARLAVLRFYESLLSLGKSKLTPDEFIKEMGEVADTSQPQWLDEKAFTSLLWNEEFFIARHESRTKIPRKLP